MQPDKSYAAGFPDAIEKAVKVIEQFQPYTPYIVGKLKINERKAALIKAIRELKK